MIVIVDYDAGNLTSVKRALDFLSIPCEISADPEKVVAAEKVIFPGVGHAEYAMKILKERHLDRALREVFSKGTPLLGICLGTQIILETSDETSLPCVGLVAGNCPKFSLNDPSLKIPHMGWDSITIKKPHPVLRHFTKATEVYFVHSYYPQPASDDDVYATCEYEVTFPVVIGRKNLIATQFHPEKSGPAGLELLANFAAWDGAAC